MCYHFCRGHVFDRFVIERPQKVNKLVFPAACLNAADDPVPFFPFPDKPRDQVRRVLKVAAHTDHAVAGCLAHRIKRRIELPEIRDVKDRFYFWIVFADLFQFFSCPVCGVVVYKQDFIIVPCKRFF